MKTFLRSALLLAAAVLALPVALLHAAGDAPLITKEDLRTMLNRPDTTILDVRLANDWESSEFKIPGAVHADPRNYPAWAGRFPRGERLVLYCA